MRPQRRLRRPPAVATSTYRWTIKWNVATGKETATLKGHTEVVSSVAFSPNGRTLASGSHDKSIKLWEVASGRNVSTIGVLSVAFSPDGNTLASGSRDKSIELWDVRMVKEVEK